MRGGADDLGPVDAVIRLQMTRPHVDAAGRYREPGEVVCLPEALADRFIALGVARPVEAEVREAVDDGPARARKAVRRGERP